jgi:hypothetical protein
VNAASAVFSVDGAPRLQIKCEGVEKMKSILITAGLAVAGLMGATNMEARTAECVTVKIPFSFTAGNRVLPAGTYKVEMLTKGQPDVDEMEVIALRGVDTRSYTAIVTRLGKSEAKAPVMAFAQRGGVAVLAEVRANGRSFALASSETEYAGNAPGTRFETASKPAIVPVAVTISQE